MSRGAFYILFTASGFAGLIYESIWTHYLKLFLGHAAYAQSLVLVIFMGGMAIGVALVRALSPSHRNRCAAMRSRKPASACSRSSSIRVFLALTDWSFDTRAARRSAARRSTSQVVRSPACSSCRSRSCSARPSR